MDGEDRKERIKKIFEESLPESQHPEQSQKGRAVKISAGHDVQYVEAGGHLILDRRCTVIINQARRDDGGNTPEQKKAGRQPKSKTPVVRLVTLAIILVLPLLISQTPKPEQIYTPTLKPAVTIPGELPIEMPGANMFPAPGCSTINLRPKKLSM